jgi:AICAR transformylase/IMP cyclohydrolase PurH
MRLRKPGSLLSSNRADEHGLAMILTGMRHFRH